MSDSVGTVISADGGPSVSEFRFVIDEENPVKRGQFVSLETPEGTMIARVADVSKSNRYFQRAESVREYERSGKSMSDLFPVNRWEYLVGEGKPLAVFKSELMQRPSLPPSPGTEIEVADDEMLSRFIGFDQESGLNIGTLSHHDVDVDLDMTRLLQKHLAILSISGGGKSYLTSVMMEELLERDPEEGQVGIVLIDTHGEYIGFADDDRYGDRTRVVTADEFTIGVPDLSIGMIAEMVPDLRPAQRRGLGRILDDMKAEGEPFDFQDLSDRIAADDRIKSSTSSVLLSHLAGLQKTGLFGESNSPPLGEIAEPGHLTIIDLSDIISLRNRQRVVAYLGRKLFGARMRGDVPPFMLVVEEAHNFAPERRKEAALSKSVIEKIAREGRKFHASLCLISQRPVKLSTTALSQCNTHVFLRITNPNDLDHIRQSAEGLTHDVISSISSLRVGEAVIVGSAVNYPVFLKVRERKSKKNERGTPLEEVAREYVEDREQRREDAQALIEDS